MKRPVDEFCHETEIVNTKKHKIEYFGNRLTKEQASTEKTKPGRFDIELFEEAKEKSQELEKEEFSEEIKSGEVFENEKNQMKLPRIEKIVLGKYEMVAWFMSPYPEEYHLQQKLYLCEFCLNYLKSPFSLHRHILKCASKCPPGDEIYREGNISIFEVDGRKNKIYCQNLCLLAKIYLDHKTLYYDVEPFLFYVMTENDQQGSHFVGYFSKEKKSTMEYNLSCIITLPCYQGKGYGQLLIDFSYLLSRVEQKTGSPEKPLSDLGFLAYRRYWRQTIIQILQQLEESREEVSIQKLSDSTGMTVEDVKATLFDLGYLKRTKDDIYFLKIDKTEFHKLLEKFKTKRRVDEKHLKWMPFLPSKRLNV